MKIRHADSRWSFELTQYRDGGWAVLVQLFGKAEHMTEGEEPRDTMARALDWALDRDGRVRYSRAYAAGTDHVYPEGSVFRHPDTGAHFTFTHLSASRTRLVGRNADGVQVSYPPHVFGVEVRDEWEPATTKRTSATPSVGVAQRLTGDAIKGHATLYPEPFIRSSCDVCSVELAEHAWIDVRWSGDIWAGWRVVACSNGPQPHPAG